jgi:hypothetical protein
VPAFLPLPVLTQHVTLSNPLYHKSPCDSNPPQSSVGILYSLSSHQTPTSTPSANPQYHYCWPRKPVSPYRPSTGRRYHSHHGREQPTKPMERSIMVPRGCASRATVMADPTLGSKAQLHGGVFSHHSPLSTSTFLLPVPLLRIKCN